jgi:hypothetical protein
VQYCATNLGGVSQSIYPWFSANRDSPTAPLICTQPSPAWKTCAFFQKTSSSIFGPKTPVAYFLFAALHRDKAFRIATASQHLSSLYNFASSISAQDQYLQYFGLGEILAELIRRYFNQVDRMLIPYRELMGRAVSR